MLKITDSIFIDEQELIFEYIRASGPGGQNVNKVASAAQLRINIVSSPSLPDDVRERLIRLAGNRMTREGEMIINARRFRSQERNRQDAVDRLVRLIQDAAITPKIRKKTIPSSQSQERRLENKRRQGEKKRWRNRISSEE